MKTVAIVAVCLALMSGIALAVCPYSVNCPIHERFKGYKEGTDVWVDMKWVATYKCVYNGHKFQMACD